MAIENSVVSVRFNETAQSVTSRAVYQYDHGLTLQVKGLEGLDVEQVHFSNSDTGKAVNHLTTIETDGSISVLIPDVLLVQDKDIDAFLYIEDDTVGFTVRSVRIPMTPRAKPESISFDSPSMGPVNALSKELEAQIEEVEDLKAGTSQATEAANASASKADTAAASATTATTNANNATTSANTAATNANTAASNAQTAADKLNSISFEVNPEDGCLYMYTA